jgi:hypothetical protein
MTSKRQKDSRNERKRRPVKQIHASSKVVAEMCGTDNNNPRLSIPDRETAE